VDRIGCVESSDEILRRIWKPSQGARRPARVIAVRFPNKIGTNSEPRLETSIEDLDPRRRRWSSSEFSYQNETRTAARKSRGDCRLVAFPKFSFDRVWFGSKIVSGYPSGR
jgi:hypothetical protein